ncbi:MAG: hypothetical protein Alpg2KO_21610 [Alphaproteobacteria bacterium]
MAAKKTKKKTATAKAVKKPEAKAKVSTPKAAPKAEKVAKQTAKAAKPEIKAKAAKPAKPAKVESAKTETPKTETPKVEAPAHVSTASEHQIFGPTGFFTTTDLNKEFETMTQDSMKIMEELSSQSKAGVDAVLASSAIFAKGFEEVARSMMAFTQSSVEEQVKASQTLMGAKTLREFTELQSEVTKTTVDRVVGEATRISELSLKTANDAAQPLTEQVNAAVKSLSAAG